MKNCICRLLPLFFVFVAGQGLALEDDAGWDFTVLFPMLWAPDISGNIDIDDQTIDIDTPFNDILDSLDFGYMAEFYARKDRWIFGLRLNYLESEDETLTDGIKLPGTEIPITPGHSITTQKIFGFTDLVIGYQVIDDIRLITGVRTVFTKIDLKIKPLDAGKIVIDKKLALADETLHDWLVGVDYTYTINPRWNLILQGDFAIAGDNDTDYAANVMLTYRISELNNLWMGYRYMRFKDNMIADNSVIGTDFVQQGPMLGWAFTF